MTQQNKDLIEVARAIWSVLQWSEDKLDTELADLPTDHEVWKMASVAMMAMQRTANPAAQEQDKERASYFVYSSENGYEACDSEQQARETAQRLIDQCRECAHMDNEWPEEAESVVWGAVMGRAIPVDEDGNPAAPIASDDPVDYVLRPAAPQPNAALADGADELVAALKLALEYWEHRQQRYKNRSPVWVQRARAAIAKVQLPAPPTLNASKEGPDHG